MITQTLDYLNNHYVCTCESLELTFAVDKTITGDFQNTYIVGQYIYIAGCQPPFDGTILNIGVYKIASVATGELTVEGNLLAEVATTYIYALAIPPQVISLISTITTWITKYQKNYGVASESVDDWSISYGQLMQMGGFKAAFGGDLSTYRKPTDDLQKWKCYCGS